MDCRLPTGHPHRRVGCRHQSLVDCQGLHFSSYLNKHLSLRGCPFVIGKTIPLARKFSSAPVMSTSSTVSSVTDVACLLFACNIVAIARFFFAVKNVLADEKVVVGHKQDICRTGWSTVSSSVLSLLTDKWLRLFWGTNPTLTEEGARGLASGVEDAGALFWLACREWKSWTALRWKES